MVAPLKGLKACRFPAAAAAAAALLLLLLGVAAVEAQDLGFVSVPSGFFIESFANGDTPGARSLAISDTGIGGATIVYVSTRRRSKVYAVIDEDSDGVGDRVVTVINDKSVPNGIAWRNGSLYVAQIHTVWRYDDVDQQAFAGEFLKDPTMISSDFPSASSHGWKFIRFGPDGKLYIPVGAPCNTCELDDFGEIAFGTINRMEPDGTELEIFARGVRNTVGFDWHPETKELWFTDNGRDGMGDNRPDDELNHAPREGLNFGFPYCHTLGDGDPYQRPPGPGKFISEPRFIDANIDCNDTDIIEAAKQPLGPHVAALGMRFYTGKMFPQQYQNSIFIATHGSWNRRKKIGYEVINVQLNEKGNKVKSLDIFASGWLRDGGRVRGRPVDVEVMKDGSLLVSDDQAGDVYRITYAGDDNLMLG